jgi:hypothetical protein
MTGNNPVNHSHLECDTVDSSRSSLAFRMKLLPPSSRFKRKSSNRQAEVPYGLFSRYVFEPYFYRSALYACCLPLAGFLAYISTLKMEAVRSSETLENIYRTTRRNIREDSAACRPLLSNDCKQHPLLGNRFLTRTH